MAKMLTLGQRHPKAGKMLIRGSFTQKKNLQDALEKVSDTPLEDMELMDDMGEDAVPYSYQRLCSKIRKNGRVAIGANGQRVFQVVEGEVNEIREWDVDDEGNPRCNPV